MKCLTFTVGDNHCVIPTDNLIEIIKYKDLFNESDDGSYLGMLKNRDEIISVSSGQLIFNAPQTEKHNQYILVTTYDDTRFGILVESVGIIVDVNELSMDSSVNTLLKSKTIVKGTIILNDVVTSVVDFSKLLK